MHSSRRDSSAAVEPVKSGKPVSIHLQLARLGHTFTAELTDFHVSFGYWSPTINTLDDHDIGLELIGR